MSVKPEDDTVCSALGVGEFALVGVGGSLSESVGLNVFCTVTETEPDSVGVRSLVPLSWEDLVWVTVSERVSAKDAV